MTRFLAKRKHLAGDELTLVDLFHLPNGSALKAFGYKGTFEKYPSVDRWFTGLQERETWVKAAAVAGTPAKGVLKLGAALSQARIMSCRRQRNVHLSDCQPRGFG